ncbi:MAG: molybdenum cofactor guanylyltransferase [Anaerolineae bacterium]
MVSGVILAGGMSRRMGRDKAWVELAGQALIERVCAHLRELCEELVVVANDPAPYARLGARLTADVWPGKGSLGGIYSGLLSARFDQAIVVACDMPFINPDLFRYMLGLAGDYDLVIPSASDPSKPQAPKSERPTAKDLDLHPLHAVYTKTCLAPMAARLQSGDLRAISFFPDVRVRVVEPVEIERFDPQRLSLFNINTTEDLALADKLIGSAS